MDESADWKFASGKSTRVLLLQCLHNLCECFAGAAVLPFAAMHARRIDVLFQVHILSVSTENHAKLLEYLPASVDFLRLGIERREPTSVGFFFLGESRRRGVLVFGS